MISVILQVGAVPFGQAIDMGRGDVKFCRIGAHTPSTVEWQNLRFGASLSEMMLSDAPPPSPLRRAHSHHFLFPCEPEKGVAPGATTSHAQPTAVPTPIQLSSKAPPSSSSCGSEGSSGWPTTEARARLETAETHGEMARDCHDRLHGPEQSVSSVRTKEGQGAKAWRSMGSDLRKIADQFHVDHAKNTNHKGRYCIILPASIAHGFAASLICLISWRLLSKLC
ncbi:uncharacterized protein LOC125042800 [Penaeus chinensis]|uniref:uncharacterized protein LOC125042800 n=1 Tax=Penaeus chinensis TaxID=139456 RepID=UPI001FB5A081|nr:uncharacterized protein LOC125042800 [Penaeus chinensis]